MSNISSQRYPPSIRNVLVLRLNMLAHVFQLADYSPINQAMITDMEALFEHHGMVNCGSLTDVSDIDPEEYLVDPLNFDLRELYDRRVPKTHFFSIYNVKRACPIPVGIITKLSMNDDDDIECTDLLPELVAKKNRSLIVQMKLRVFKF